MTELHWALLALAGVLLVALVGYNRWTERRALRRLDQSMRAGVFADTLMAPTATLPTTSSDPWPATRPGDMPVGLPAHRVPAAAAAAPDLLRGRVEPRLNLPSVGTRPGDAADGGAFGELASTEPATLSAPGAWAEDPLLDFVVELRCTHALDGVTVFDGLLPLLRLDLPLPVHVVAWDARAQQWVKPDRFGFYSDLLAAIQLADRRQALDAIGASRFLAAVQQSAIALDADVDLPEASRMVELAGELDRLCAQFDVQIGLTIESVHGPWDAALVEAAIAEAGLEPVAAQRWHRRDGQGRVLFALASGSLLADKLVLELDVATAPRGARPFDQVLEAARQLGARLGARVVDDNGREITPTALAAIEAQLETLYEQMATGGIEAGSLRAQRLYRTA
jgi:hypothetical protein